MAITKPLPGSVNAPLGTGAQSGVNVSGGVAMIKVQGLSSDIVVAPANVLTVSGGDVFIENIVVETDATGLAGGTNVQFSSDDPIGASNLLAETVANLGANKTVDINTASVAKQRATIRNGFHLRINSTAAPCTGVGVWNAVIQYRPEVPSASMS